MPRVLRPAVIAPVVVVALVTGGVLAALPGSSMAVTGLDHPTLSAAALKDAVVTVDSHGKTAKILIDGKTVVSGSKGPLTASLAGLSEGRHVIVAQVAGGFLEGTTKTARTVVVDATPPALAVTQPTSPVKPRSPVTLSGTVEQDARLTASGGTLTRTGGTFTVAYPTPPAGATLTAIDPAGNVVVRDVTIKTVYPLGVRGVHMTGRAWAYSKLRDPVLQMIKEHRINAVQLDIKDEDGIVNYPSQVAMAKTVGATSSLYDAKRVTDELHAMGVRVVGRIVAFNDPKLADWAVSHGHKDWVIQNPDGSKYLYGYNKHGFSNFAAQPVRDYNTDLAVEAAKLGFDDVVFDYIRRPDGPLAKMRFPGLKGDPADSIVSFLADTQPKVRAAGGSLGAAAFAQASTRPQSTSQNIQKMALHLDLVIPMDYPSHWNDGEYGVPNVYAGAQQIVQRSLVDWKKAVAGTGCVVVPWLQDEDYRGTYDAAKVKEQIAGARADGLPGWLMWSAGATYTPAAFTPDAPSVR